MSKRHIIRCGIIPYLIKGRHKQLNPEPPRISEGRKFLYMLLEELAKKEKP